MILYFIFYHLHTENKKFGEAKTILKLELYESGNSFSTACNYKTSYAIDLNQV